MSNFQKLVVFPDLPTASDYEDDERFVDFIKLCTTDGEDAFYGRRLKSIWIHWNCLRKADFVDIANALVHVMSFQSSKIEVEQKLFR